MARTKLLTDAVYSPTIAASEEAIRTQIDDSIQEVLDLALEDVTTNRKLSPTGDFTGTINGGDVTLTEPGLSGAFNAHLAEYVYLSPSGGDDYAALQEKMDEAAAAQKALILKGNFLISQPLIGKNDLCMYARSFLGASITATASMDSIIRFDTTSRSVFLENVKLNGAGLADYGIKSLNNTIEFAHSIIARNYITATKIAAIKGFKGICNEFINNEIVLNEGDGIQLDGTGTYLNIINLENNKIYSNDGVGIYASGGRAINILKNTIEANKKAGVYINTGCQTINIKKNYFEANAITGIVFTTPARTVNADIIINGSSNNITEMSRLYPAKNVDISNNNTAGAANQPFVYAIAVDGLIIKKNNGAIATPNMYVFKKPVETAYSSVTDVKTIQNKNFIDIYEMDGTYTNDAKQLSHTWSFEEVLSRLNYITANFLGYLKKYTYSGGTIARSQTKYNGFDTFEITGVSGGYSDQWGISIDLANYPELQNKWIRVSAKVYAPDANCGPTMFIGSKSSHTSTSSYSTFTEIAMEYKTGASGTIDVAFGTISTNAAGKVYFCNPTVSLVGVKPDESYNEIPTPKYISAAMPSSGYWAANMYVEKTAKVEAGTAGSKYFIKGWARLTTGSNNVLGTDWLEDRALTGN
jgi:hypothetical protein